MRSFVKLPTNPSGSGDQSGGRRGRQSEAYLRRELKQWRPFRIFGIFASVMAFTFAIISLCSRHWTVGYNWQNAVIGLLVFSVAFGFLATVLSICGVCTTTLAKKIYYYHSAGEIYFICAVSCTAALMVYPVAIQIEEKMIAHQFGVGYGLGWGAAFFFFAAAMCMCLDDLVRTIARGLCCRWCDKKNNGNGNAAGV